jgi:hypothetical protein
MYCINTYNCPVLYVEADNERKAIKIASRLLKEGGVRRRIPQSGWSIEMVDSGVSESIVKRLPTQEDQAEASKALLTNLAKCGHPVYRWVEAEGKPVNITPISVLPEIAARVQAWVEQYKPEIKQCYMNSYYCMQKVSGVRVVHGYVTSDKSGCIIEHAWNEFKGHHFDVTSEAYRLGLQGHLQVVILNSMQCNSLMVDCGAHCHYVLPAYERLVRTERAAALQLKKC